MAHCNFPELRRKPDEDDFAYSCRLTNKSWPIGTVKLMFKQYELESERLPVDIRVDCDWFKELAPESFPAFISLEFSQAKLLFQQGDILPCYAKLGLNDRYLKVLELLIGTAERKTSVAFNLQPDAIGFRDNQDGTITDLSTDLTWMRFAVGQEWNGRKAKGGADERIWYDFIELIDELNLTGGFAGKNGWRLPTVEELKTLGNRNYPDAVWDCVFPNNPRGFYWSSVQDTTKEYPAWHIYLNDSLVLCSNGFNESFARLVRSERSP